MPNTWLVNLDAEIIAVGIVSGLLHERFTVAKTYFKYAWRASTEHGVQIDCRKPRIDTVGWPQLFQCALLRRR